MRGLRISEKSFANSKRSAVITFDVLETFLVLLFVVFFLGFELLALLLLFLEVHKTPPSFIYYSFLLPIPIAVLMLFVDSGIRIKVIAFIMLFELFLGGKLGTLVSFPSYNKALSSPNFFNNFFSIIPIDILTTFLLVVLFDLFFRKIGEERWKRLYTGSKVKLILFSFAIVLSLFSTGFGLEELFLHIFIKEKTMLSLCLDSFKFIFLILFVAISAAIPCILALSRVYKRNFTPLTRSSIEIFSGFLLAFSLALISASIIALLSQGRWNLNAFAELLTSYFKFLGIELILVIIFLVLFMFPMLMYMDKRQKIPYTSFLQVYFTTLVTARGLPGIITVISTRNRRDLGSYFFTPPSSSFNPNISMGIDL